MGICVQAGDVLRAYAGNDQLTVIAWGEEDEVSSSAGGGAPTDAQYLVSASHADLTNERVVGNGTNLVWDFSTPGVAILNITPALGTLAQQNASAVAITGGSAVGLSSLTATSGGFDGNTLAIDSTNHRVGVGTFSPAYGLDVAGITQVQNRLYVGGVIGSPARVEIKWTRAAEHGMAFFPTADTGANTTLLFHNSGGTQIGSITQTASATAYNTSSDARLKHAITTLTGALDRVRALKPISHLWKADNSKGYGFKAHEVQDTIPDGGIVTGERDAVDAEGNIVPQQMDLSKLVPWLTAAVQELSAQVDTLLARVATLEGLTNKLS
jgi:hypothetical protein